MAGAPIGTFTLHIVVAENDPSIRRFFRESLESQPGYRIVGEAATGSEMVRTVLTLEPQVVVFDTQLPGCNGLDALQQITQNLDIAAVVITPAHDQHRVCQLLDKFELVYLVKPVQEHQVALAVQVAWTLWKRMRYLHEEITSLRQALENRKIIERAKGVLMKRYRLAEAEAYRRLQREAMNERTPLVKLAQAVLDGTNLCNHNSFTKK